MSATVMPARPIRASRIRSRKTRSGGLWRGTLETMCSTSDRRSWAW